MRFRLTQAYVADGHVRYAAGEVLTNDQPLTVPGDRYVAGLSAATIGPGFEPLDAAAVAAKSVSAFKNEVLRTWICGADSIR